MNNSDWKSVKEWNSLEKRVLYNTSIILSFLKKHNIKASFFVLGWIAEQYPDLIKQIADAGHDIGCHSYYHRIPKYQNKNEFEKDLKKGIALLEKITNKTIIYYRAPNFSLKNKWMLDCLTDYGIQISSSIKNPMHHNGIKLPNKPFVFTKNKRSIIELPLLTKNLIITKFVYSGSGYFRLLPYNIIKKLLSDLPYTMMYFHPNDFDVNIPTPKELGYIRNTLNSIKTSTTLPKLEKLTEKFSFISISHAMELLDKEKFVRVEY